MTERSENRDFVNLESLNVDEVFIDKVFGEILKLNFPEDCKKEKETILQVIMTQQKIPVKFSDKFEEHRGKLAFLESIADLKKYCEINNLLYPDEPTLILLANEALINKDNASGQAN